MKILAAAVLFLLAVPLLAADDPRIAEGIALHEAGKYDEAIAKYREVLADSPGDRLAIYEMAFAYMAKGDYASCRATLEPIADKRDDYQPMILVVLGNCLDSAGDSRRAIEVYRRGLKIAPNDGQLLYNLAVTLAGQQKHAEARELLKKELVVRPGHASGHYLLGQVFEIEGFRGPAILSYLRMLAVEYGTPRTADVAKRVVGLLNLGVEKKGEGDINITLDSSSRTEEGDFKGWETMLAIASAARFTTENELLTDFESTRSQLAMSLRMLVEAPPKGKSYTVRQNVPFFVELETKKLLDAFAGIALASLDLEGEQEWAKQNEAAIREFATFAQGLPR